MIINNYDNSLHENKETSMTFGPFGSPKVLVRKFDFNFVDGEAALVIPYYVTDADDTKYNDDHINATFTTIIAFDEDTVPAEQVRTIKKTTYAGDFIFDLSDTDEYPELYTRGVHSFSIRTIQSNGIGSATQYFRYIIRKPIVDDDIFDLMSADDFEVTVTDQEHIISTDDYGIAVSAFKRILTATYAVSIDRTDSTLNSITVEVSNSSYVDRGITATGETTETVYGSGTLDGTYVFATECTQDGITAPLKIWINGYYPDPVPKQLKHNNTLGESSLNADDVVKAAAGNKAAMTMLFEAAKNYGYRVIRFPENMDIVVDYRKASTGMLGSDLNYWGRDDIRIPDEFTVDLNGSTIYVLRIGFRTNSSAYQQNGAGYSKVGTIFRLNDNFDSHLINGKLVGNFKYSNCGSLNKFYYGEHIKMLLCYGGSFCSFEGLDISMSVGYELVIVSNGSPYNGQYDATLAPPFDKDGYIDYEGNICTSIINHVNKPKDVHMMYTNAFVPVSHIYWNFCDATLRIKRTYDNHNSNARHRPNIRDLFVHFYDNNKNFIKTVKVEETWPTLPPYGAAYMRLSMCGSYENGATTEVNECLNVYYGSAQRGRWCKYVSRLPWCFTLQNCTIHDTRTTTLDNGGIQQLIDSCTFYNIATVRSGSEYSGDDKALTPWMVDLEDDSYSMYNFYINNCEFLYGATAGLDVQHGYNYFATNCKGLAFVALGDVANIMIDSSYGSITRYYTFQHPKAITQVNNVIMKRGASAYQSKFSRGPNVAALLTRGSSLLYEDNEDVNTTFGSVTGKQIK